MKLVNVLTRVYLRNQKISRGYKGQRIDSGFSAPIIRCASTAGDVRSTNINNPLDNSKIQQQPPNLGEGQGPSLSDALMAKVHHYMAVYEEFIGIKQVKEAHARVLLAEERFVQSQEKRRDAQADLLVLQNQLRELRGDLDRTPRGNENYLELITKEINVMRQEKVCRTKFEAAEKIERESFNELSSALRFSHEKEREQNEKTKYWSILGSLVGACVGIIGASINSHLKIKQLKRVMTESSAEGVAQMQEKLAILLKHIDEKQNSSFREPVTNLDSPITQYANEEESQQIRASLDSVCSKLDELIVTVQNIDSKEIVSESNVTVLPREEYEMLIRLQESNMRKNVSVATVTILLCVPLVNKILSLFF